MSDRRLRERERLARTGTAEDRAAWLRERLRAGLVTPRRVELAAYCGDEAAQRACGLAVHFVCHKDLVQSVMGDIRGLMGDPKRPRDSLLHERWAWRNPDPKGPEGRAPEVRGWLAIDACYFFSVDADMADGFWSLMQRFKEDGTSE